MKKSVLFIAISLSIVLLSGCKVRKQKSNNDTSTTTTQTLPSGDLNTKYIVEQNEKASQEIKFLNISSAEMVLEYYGNRMSVKVQIQVIKDKEICLSVLPLLGIELYRVKITPEKFYIFDKLHKKYCDGSYEYLSALTGADIKYKDIEALLTNRLFSLEKGKTVENGYTVEQEPTQYRLKSKSKAQDFEHTFEISPDYKVISTAIQNSQNQHIRVGYKDFVNINKVLFPITVGVEAQLPEQSFNANIEIKKIEINKEFEIKQLDFKKYTRTDCKKIF